MHCARLIALFLFLCHMAGAAQHQHRNDLESIIRRGPMISTRLRAVTTEAAQSAAALYNFKTLDVPGASQTFPQSINRSGEIVGGYSIGDFQHGFLLNAQGLQTVDFPGAINSGLSGINTRGQILGGWVDDAHHSVLLNKTLDKFREIQFPNTFATQASGLNDYPQIVGRYVANVNDIDYGILHAFLFNGRSYSTIDFPGSYWSEALSINNLGTIVGNYGTLPYRADSHGFLLNGGRKRGFATFDFPGAIATIASGINDAGDIVGSYQSEDGGLHGFLFKKGVFYTLDYPGALYSTLGSINQFGQITGQFYDAEGLHGFYAEPKAITIRNRVKD